MKREKIQSWKKLNFIMIAWPVRCSSTCAILQRAFIPLLALKEYIFSQKANIIFMIIAMIFCVILVEYLILLLLQLHEKRIIPFLCNSNPISNALDGMQS